MHSYDEIAKNYDLWLDYVEEDIIPTEQQFNDIPHHTKKLVLVGYFGIEKEIFQKQKE